jgi:hypothetical protein
MSVTDDLVIPELPSLPESKVSIRQASLPNSSSGQQPSMIGLSIQS